MMYSRRRLFTTPQLSNFIKFSTKIKPNQDVEGFPAKMLNKKLKTPPHMYLKNAKTAQIISKALEPYMKKSKYKTIFELNPGIGMLTSQLLKHKNLFEHLVLVEPMEHFLPILHNFKEQYPQSVEVKQGDLVNLWKLAYQDKIDNGTRVNDLLERIPKQSYEDDVKVMFCGAVGSYNFFKHLINAIIFQNSLFTYGRSDMFLIIPPPIYIHLTCSKDIGYLLYRSSSMLFQILFEYKFIKEVPREHFLPPQSDYSIGKHSKLGKVNSVDPEFLFLVKITARPELLKLCPVEDLPALWYFVKQNCISRRNRIIPNLEKWIPGCGPRLIVNQSFVDKVKNTYPDENVKNLPKYSVPSTTLSHLNYHSHMNLYTQFGDLTPSEMFTLFKEFRQWPEYSDSSFLASLDNCLLKLETSEDDSIDAINEEDDINSTELNSTILQDENIEPVKTEQNGNKAKISTNKIESKRKKKSKVDVNN